jgi:ADP-ribosylglycohydrolase
MPGWNQLTELIKVELNEQAREEGKDPDAIEALRLEAQGDDSALESVLARLIALPVSPDFPYQEPDDLAEIRAARPGRRPVSLPALESDEAVLSDRIYGAWLGRCVGCALGKPFEGDGLGGNGTEGKMSGGIDSSRPLQAWERVKQKLVSYSPDEWPIRDYCPSTLYADVNWCPGSRRGKIAFMESDDDIRYSVLGLELLREKGMGFSTWDVALGWMKYLPYRAVCTAETQAYRNLISRYEFHAGSDWGRCVPDVDWNWVATHSNPYREWIGAQIRVDAYGYAAAGRPELAAELAWRDARLSHTKNGIYGAMFCAAMIAAAFVTDDVHSIVESGLAEIPENCRLAEAVRRTLAIAGSYGDDPEKFEEVFRDLHVLFGCYSSVHTIPNAVLCAAALILSGGDFHKGVTLAVMGGWDTDCNGATVGSLVGAITGAARAPRFWTERLNDTLRSEIVEYHPIAISECARRTLDLVRTSLPGE